MQGPECHGSWRGQQAALPPPGERPRQQWRRVLRAAPDGSPGNVPARFHQDLHRQHKHVHRFGGDRARGSRQRLHHPGDQFQEGKTTDLLSSFSSSLLFLKPKCRTSQT